MDINLMDQGLLKRNPAMTPEEFSHHWFTKHAPLVVPFFLHSGISHYEQMHGPLSTTTTTNTTSSSTSSPTAATDTDVDITAYDGAAGMPPQEALDAFPAGLPAWKEAYYREVILPDERRFLASEALAHIRRVGPGTVRGERRVVIRDGKCVVDVPGEVWRVWRAYEARGGEEEEENGEGEEENGEEEEEEEEEEEKKEEEEEGGEERGKHGGGEERDGKDGE